MLNFNFDISEPRQKNNIVVFFLSSKEQMQDNFLSFPEALKNNLTEVEEVNEPEGFVGNLKVTNKSENQKLLILGSEILIGNKLKQDRTVDETVLISENSTTTLKVSCCEKNRWSPAVSKNNISLSETLLFSKARTNNAEDIYNSKQNRTDQLRVWDDIDEKFEEHEVKSFTSSVEDIYKKRRNNVEEIVKSFQPSADHTGVVIGINSRLISLDVFPNSTMLKIYLPRLIRSVSLDSFKRTNYKSYLKIKDVYKFLRLIEHSNKRVYKSTSLGDYLIYNDLLVSGSVLTYKQKTIHFSGFLKELSTSPDYKRKVA